MADYVKGSEVVPSYKIDISPLLSSFGKLRHEEIHVVPHNLLLAKKSLLRERMSEQSSHTLMTFVIGRDDISNRTALSVVAQVFWKVLPSG